MNAIILWLVGMGLALGAEIVAWQVPVDLVVEGGLENFSVSRMDEPPGESEFFEKGDELWDLSRAIDYWLRGPSEEIEDPFAGNDDPSTAVGVGKRDERFRKVLFEGEWAVWNVRSQMIVARGTMRQLSVVDQAIRLEDRPRLVTVTIDLKIGNRTKKLSTVSRSGEKSEAVADGLTLMIAPNLSGNSEWIDLSIDVGLAQEELSYQVSTSYTLRRGQRKRIASWSEGGQDFELGVRAEVMMFWGCPLDEARRNEAGDPYQLDRPLDERMLNGALVDDNLEARIFVLPPDFLKRIESPIDEIEVEQLVIPDEFAEFMTARYLNVAPHLQASGVTFSNPLAIAGLDTKTNLLVVVNDAESLELVRMITMTLGGCEVPRVVELAFEWPDGLASLVARSGDKASICRGRKNKGSTLLEIAPNVGSSGNIIDVIYNLGPVDGSFRLNSAATLYTGKTIEIGSFSEGGVGKKVTLTATVENE